MGSFDIPLQNGTDLNDWIKRIKEKFIKGKIRYATLLWKVTYFVNTNFPKGLITRILHNGSMMYIKYQNIIIS